MIENVGDKQSVTLTITPQRCEVHTSYLMVENITNPADLKIVRLYMEGITAQSTCFNVLVDEQQKDAEVCKCMRMYATTHTHTRAHTYTRPTITLAN